ncbi:MAG TPA: deoxyribodipyrimidine photo-lyase [Candidatus Binataceae bacterium]|nr:deoxyribodipyrimidine photo-lyase [Candidatus Binataceae bacterium]
MEWWTADARIEIRRGGLPAEDGRCVVYWMQRAQRAFDNPALETAIRTANQLRKPVVAFFAMLATHPVANLRHYTFMIEGLIDTAHRLGCRGIGFVMRTTAGSDPVPAFLKFCDEVKPAVVIADENPLRNSARWRVRATEAIRVPMLSVDADVIVPSVLLEKEQYAARTIRPRIRAMQGDYLKPVGNLRPLVRWRPSARLSSLEPSLCLLKKLRIDTSVGAAPGIHGGTSEALSKLKRFISDRLPGYATHRNHPEIDGTSGVSPYLHFGHIGPHTVALAALDSRAAAHDRDSFLEELIVRRELAVNFVRYNATYDSLDGCPQWARDTLDAHARDERPYRYSEAQLERADTHDPLWNAAQRQMVESGWMHNYMRMYWAKKILEWSRSPAEAFRIAVRLNDRYELDGRDPNGYAGIAWAIGGKHDRAWGPERKIYGLIRYMSLRSTSRKFDSKSYIERWSGAAGATDRESQRV